LILELATREVLEANRGALHFFERRYGHPVEVRDHITLGTRHYDLLELLVSGRLVGFDASLPSEAAGEVGQELRVWVRRLVEHDGGCHVAVIVLTQGGDIDQTIFLPAARPAQMVVGATDDEWRAEWVTPEVTRLLGYEPDEFTGMPLLAIAHPDTAGETVAALTYAGSRQGSAVVDARLRAADGTWRASSMIVSPRPGEGTGVMFLLLPPAAHVVPGPTDPDRHLARVGDDVHAAALVRDGDLQSRLPEGLSSRQWEIVTRLQRGERVPGIAAAMYLSQSTVRNHLVAVFRKFGVHSQAELLARLRAGDDQDTLPRSR
jgi:DNA-binding CsgD family transcriptional regulator